jgi:uncharacterized protein (TIGR03032 family)
VRITDEVNTKSKPPRREVRYRHSELFLAALRQMRCTLLVSTYQAGKVIAVGASDDGISLSFHEVDQAMGVAARDDLIAIGARGQVSFLADNSQIAPLIEPAGRYDRLYLERTSTKTGGIQCHEMAWGRAEDGGDELWIVNTRFSCLANLHERYSFVPRWQPPFISQIAAEDRCHMNGLGMRDGRPAVVTAMSQTDVARGWREHKNTTGVILDVATGQPITTGLAMPHSPRFHDGRLLVLNSGHGAIEGVDPDSGERTVIEKLPGFTRGLACRGNLAFVGLSRIRETAVFGGVPIAERHHELRCGIGVVDLDTGRTVATLEFESGVEEIFDVQVLGETQCVSLGGEAPDGGDSPDIWVLPRPQGDPTEELALSDSQVTALATRAAGLQRQGRQAEAIGLLRRAHDARPDDPRLVNDLGNALQESGDAEGAMAAYRQAVAADPGFAPALQNLGHILVARGMTDEGIARLERAQTVAPTDVTRVLIATSLPIIYRDHPELEERRAGIESRVQALVAEGVQIDPTRTHVPTNFYAVYQGHNDRDLHANFGRIYTGEDLTGTATNRPRTDGRIRVGFLSAYFTNHTIGRLNLGRVAQMDRSRFEVTVLSAVTGDHPVAADFRRLAERYIHLPRNARAARQLIAEQDLDLLFFTDVGMDPMTYALAFSRMAPVQAVTWGHPVTTGSPTMDCFISSEALELPEADDHYTERLVRLPSLGTYYYRPAAPQRNDMRARLGLGADDHVYICPQTLFKFHPDNDVVLGEILRRDPKGVLLMIDGKAPTWRELLQGRFARSFPDAADRVRWIKPLPHPAFLNLIAAAEVALDPLVFGGGNSTYEMLGVGTPVVTLPSPYLRGRITQALYAKMGYGELVADSPERYVELALALGTDRVHRAAVSAAVSERAEVLFEDAAEVRDLEAFFASAVASR